ncbi:MAG: hypothetical protein HY269_07980 [Deltaproteobacteria bacterium]|nr:hypothetical protein [Deltaproteobacteria bacterium]
MDLLGLALDHEGPERLLGGRTSGRLGVHGVFLSLKRLTKDQAILVGQIRADLKPSTTASRHKSTAARRSRR